MKIRKILSTILAGIITFSLIIATACGSEESSSSAVGGNEQQTGYVPKETDYYMVQDGKSDYKIVIPSTANSQELTAGDEMQYFLKESLGVELEIVYDKGLKFNSNSKYISLGENDLAETAGVEASEAELSASGYVIRTVGKSIFLVGAGTPGTMFSVYGFLEMILGYKCYAIDEVHIDKRTDLKLYDFNYAYKPQFDVFNLGFAEMAWHSGLGSRFYQGDAYIIPGTGAHCSFMYFPKEQYADLHPEWYSSDFAQMCYSSETLVDALVEKYIVDLETYSPKDVYGRNVLNFGIEDNTVWCNCAKCKATVNKYGANSATMVLFINKVADKVQAWIDENQPGRIVYIGVMAYQPTQEPPVKVDSEGKVTYQEEMKLRDNVMVRLAPIDAAWMYSIGDRENNLTAYNQLVGWGAICKNIGFYGYCRNYRHGFVNFDVWNAIQDNYKFYIENNVFFLTEQGTSYTIGSAGFMDFTIYLMTEWGRDVNKEFNVLKEDFFTAYYKEAKAPIEKFFDEMRLHYLQLADQHNINGGVYEDMYNQEMWSQGLLEKWLGYFDEAFALIEPFKETNPEKYELLYGRICQESLQPRFLMIHLYATKAYSVTELYEQKKRFFEDCEKYEVSPSEGQSLAGLKEEWGFV